LGYKSASGAEQAVRSAIRKVLQEPAEAVRELEAMRLDALLQALWGKALDGDVLVIDRVLKIMDRRARLLGLDAPTKTQQENTGEVQHEHQHRTWMQEVEHPSVERTAKLLELLAKYHPRFAASQSESGGADTERMDPEGTD
jgi:hypothetical protein